MPLTSLSSKGRKSSTSIKWDGLTTSLAPIDYFTCQQEPLYAIDPFSCWLYNLSYQLSMNFEEESSDLSSAQEQQVENELNNKLLSNYRKIKDSLRKQQLSSNSKYSINELENAI